LFSPQIGNKPNFIRPGGLELKGDVQIIGEHFSPTREAAIIDKLSLNNQNRKGQMAATQLNTHRVANKAMYQSTTRVPGGALGASALTARTNNH